MAGCASGVPLAHMMEDTIVSIPCCGLILGVLIGSNPCIQCSIVSSVENIHTSHCLLGGIWVSISGRVHGSGTQPSVEPLNLSMTYLI